MMNQSKDPFEAAFEEQNQSPPTSPVAEAPDDDYDAHTPAAPAAVGDQDDDGDNTPAPPPPPAVTNNNVDSVYHSNQPTSSAMPTAAGVNVPRTTRTAKNKEEDDEEEEENMEAELAKLPSTGDPNKMAKMQAILSQFTEGQMSRYESFRRSGFQKTNMRRLLVSATGSQKISLPMTIVVCGIAKLFVGELVETARMVMKERKESGPIRPCHIREAYRRLKLEGKVPKRSIPRLFH